MIARVSLFVTSLLISLAIATQAEALCVLGIGNCGPCDEVLSLIASKEKTASTLAKIELPHLKRMAEDLKAAKRDQECQYVLQRVREIAP